MTWTLRRILTLIVILWSVAVLATLVWVANTYQRFAIETQNQVTGTMLTYQVRQQVEVQYRDKVTPFIDEWSRLSTLVNGMHEGSTEKARLAANRMMHTMEVAEGRVRLRNVVVYNKDMDIVATAERGTGESLHSLPALVARLKKRTLAQKRLIATLLWRTPQGRPVHSAVAPIGGFQVAGFIEFVSDPIPELSGMSEVFGGAFQLKDGRDKVLFETTVEGEEPAPGPNLDTLSVTIPDALGGTWATATLTRDTTAFKNRVADLRNDAILIVVSVVAGSIIVGWLLLRLSVFGRLRAFATSMGRLAEGQTDVEIPATGPDEFGIMRDALGSLRTAVEERERAQAAVQESRERLRAIIDATPNAVYLKDRDGRYTLVNKSIAERQGLTPETMVGHTAYDHFPKEVADQVAAADDHVFATGEVVEREVEIPIRHGEGGTYIGLMVKFPVKDVDGNVISVGSITYNITERKEAERIINEARAAAEAANQAKSDFLSSMSHELRTPLNTIIGFSRFVLEDEAEPLTNEQRDCISQVLTASRHLLVLIDEVLDLSKIEAGAISLSPESINAGQVVDECVSLSNSLAQRRGIVITNLLTGHPLPPIRVDRTRFKQVLLNLLSNSVKYNREEGRVFIEHSQPAPGRLRIGVRDTGAGIPPERLEAIFEPFDRLGAEHSGIEGTGIGLTITKRLVEQMGGAIGVKSALDRGSTFWVEFPITDEEARIESGVAEPEEAPAETIAGKILYIEDNPTNLELVQKIMSRQPGVTLIGAPTAELGIQRARTERPDVILLDIHLPGMDGYEALARLHAAEETAQIPVIAVTAAATRDDLRKGSKAGFFEYLTKPVEARKLLETIARAIHPTDVPAARRTGRVLVIDDVAVNLSVAAKQLARLGIECDTSDDPAEGLKKLQSGAYAAGLVDISMPGISGLELAERLRASETPDRPRTPLIALTASHATDAELKRMRESGIDAQLTKPVNIEQLSQVLGPWLEGGAEADRDAAEGQGDAPIDLGQLADILGTDDREQLGEVLDMFVGSFPEMLEKLESAVAGKHADEARTTARAARGASSNSAAWRLAEILDDVEAAVGDGDWMALDARTRDLRAEFGKIEAFRDSFADGP